MRYTFLGVLIVAATGAASSLAAQECIGLPLGSAQSALAGNLSFADNTTTIGGQFSHNAAGTLSLGGGAGIVMADGENGLAANGVIAIDFPVTGLKSSCLVSGIRYTTFSFSSGFIGFPGAEFDAKLTGLVVPIGFGIGTSMPASPSTSLLLHGVPELLLARTSTEIETPVGSQSDSNTELAFGLILGGTLVSQRLFGGLAVEITTLDGDSDVVFTINVGTVLGRRR
jgi:hypothetical protein